MFFNPRVRYLYYILRCLTLMIMKNVFTEDLSQGQYVTHDQFLRVVKLIFL